MIIWFHKPKRWCFICCLVTICRLVSECTFNSPITRKKIGFSGAIFLENWHRLSKPMFNLIRILRRIGSSIYKKVILLRYKVGLIHFKCLNMALANSACGSAVFPFKMKLCRVSKEEELFRIHFLLSTATVLNRYLAGACCCFDKCVKIQVSEHHPVGKYFPTILADSSHYISLQCVYTCFKNIFYIITIAGN